MSFALLGGVYGVAQLDSELAAAGSESAVPGSGASTAPQGLGARPGASPRGIVSPVSLIVISGPQAFRTTMNLFSATKAWTPNRPLQAPETLQGGSEDVRAGQFEGVIRNRGVQRKPLTRFHDLRHTFATRLAAQGVPDPDLCRLRPEQP